MMKGSYHMNVDENNPKYLDSAGIDFFVTWGYGR